MLSASCGRGRLLSGSTCNDKVADGSGGVVSCPPSTLGSSRGNSRKVHSLTMCLVFDRSKVVLLFRFHESFYKKTNCLPHSCLLRAGNQVGYPPHRRITVSWIRSGRLWIREIGPKSRIIFRPSICRVKNPAARRWSTLSLRTGRAKVYPRP
jgi:hypothetical protein